METNTVNSLAEASRENFWTILKEKKYTICIPRIQRDYAQGREEPEPTQIRQIFLKDVFRSLENNSPMDVNFIYGNIDKDKKGAERFVPIDGQQRLTTLFLLHWYFATWSGKLSGENEEILGRFQYETRFVTGDFCRRLVEEVKLDLKELVVSERSLTEVIKDYYWFFSAYDHDATVKAMLVMLQEIHDMVKALEDNSIVDGFFDTLTAIDGPVSFLFLNIADVGLTDEIYIKMNARGKALTRFENFKAQLSSYLSGKDDQFSREFIGNINGIWSQFFWHEEYRPDVESKEDKKVLKKSTVYDNQIMALFRFIMMNEYITNVETDDSNTSAKSFGTKVLKNLSEENDSIFMNHLFADEFRSVPLYKTEKANVDIEAFRFIYTLLNVLAKRKQDTGSICFVEKGLYAKEYIDEENFFRRLIRSVNERTLSYEDQILLYAEFCFLVRYANDDYSFDKKKELTEWIRFVYNLTRNMLYNSYADSYRSIRRVRKIVKDGDAIDILGYAAALPRREYKQGSGYGFVENQMIEECIKANLLLRGDKWRSQVTLAENSFLGSQIAAILAFSGIWEMYEKEMSEYEAQNVSVFRLPDFKCILKAADAEAKYIDTFALYLKKFNMIFGKDDLKPELDEQSLLRRALLTFGGEDCYMLPAGKPVRCFLDATERDASFRRLFRGDSPVNRRYFQQLLDQIDITKDIVPQLQSIIDAMTYDDKSRWKQYFIEMPEILECMYQNKNKADPDGKFVFRSPKRYICRRSADQILLLERTMTTSTNREYYSYVLYLKAIKQGLKVSYFTTYSENTEKYLTYTNKQGKEIQVLYVLDDTSANQEYKYTARENGIVLYKSNIVNMLDYIQQTIQV